jgi:hypothetical protein
MACMFPFIWRNCSRITSGRAISCNRRSPPRSPLFRHPRVKPEDDGGDVCAPWTEIKSHTHLAHAQFQPTGKAGMNFAISDDASPTQSILHPKYPSPFSPTSLSSPTITPVPSRIHQKAFWRGGTGAGWGVETQGLPSGVWQMIPSATTGGEADGCGPTRCFSGCPNG